MQTVAAAVSAASFFAGDTPAATPTQLDRVARYYKLSPMKLRPGLKYWLPVFAWMAVIYIASTDVFSAAHTSRFIGPLLRWFAPDISDSTVATVQFIARKCAHLTEYAILAALILRALRQYSQRLALIGTFAFAICGLYAALDEFHQTFVASRTGAAEDVMIDCSGAVLGIAIYCWLRNRKSKIANRK